MMDRRTTAAATIMIALTFTLAMTAAAQLGVFGQAEPTSAAPIATLPGTAAAGQSAPATSIDASTAPAAPVTVAAAAAGGQRSTPAANGPANDTGTTAPGAATTPATTPGTTATTTATTAATTTATPTTTGGRPTLYTVSGWLVPANYSVPSKWWTKPIPDFPLGNWAKCKLEDDGWACEH